MIGAFPSLTVTLPKPGPKSIGRVRRPAITIPQGAHPDVSRVSPIIVPQDARSGAAATLAPLPTPFKLPAYVTAPQPGQGGGTGTANDMATAPPAPSNESPAFAGGSGPSGDESYGAEAHQSTISASAPTWMIAAGIAVVVGLGAFALHRVLPRRK